MLSTIYFFAKPVLSESCWVFNVPISIPCRKFGFNGYTLNKKRKSLEESGSIFDPKRTSERLLLFVLFLVYVIVVVVVGSGGGGGGGGVSVGGGGISVLGGEDYHCSGVCGLCNYSKHLSCSFVIVF